MPSPAAPAPSQVGVPSDVRAISTPVKVPSRASGLHCGFVTVSRKVECRVGDSHRSRENAASAPPDRTLLLSAGAPGTEEVGSGWHGLTRMRCREMTHRLFTLGDVLGCFRWDDPAGLCVAVRGPPFMTFLSGQAPGFARTQATALVWPRAAGGPLDPRAAMAALALSEGSLEALAGWCRAARDNPRDVVSIAWGQDERAVFEMLAEAARGRCTGSQ